SSRKRPRCSPSTRWRSSSAICRRCARSPRSARRRRSSRYRWISSRRSCRRSERAETARRPDARLGVGDDRFGDQVGPLTRALRPNDNTGNRDSLAVGEPLVGALIHLAQIQGDARAPIGLKLHRVGGDPLDIAVDSKALLAVSRGRADREAEQEAEDANSHPRLRTSYDHISVNPPGPCGPPIATFGPILLESCAVGLLDSGPGFLRQRVPRRRRLATGSWAADGSLM